MMPESEKSHESIRTISIQEAQLEDVPGIAEVQSITWLGTYPNDEHGISRSDIQEWVDRWSPEESIKILRESIEGSDGNSFRLVAKDGDKVVGHCLVIKTEPYNKLQVLYVLPDYQGMGVGKQLAQQGMEWLGKERDVALEVVTYNKGAIEFYKKMGFEIIGDARSAAAELPSGKIMPEYQMVKHLR